MILKTERLILRPWVEEDANNLYLYCKDDRIGPIAGFPLHKSVEDSKNIIKNVLSKDGTFAVCLKEDNKAIGSIGLMMGKASNLKIGENEAEIGYWIGVPFWGRGLIPEAIREIIKYSYETLKLKKLWCGYFEGNLKSKRAQEKCGFKYVRTDKDIEWKLMNDIRTEHIESLDLVEIYKEKENTKD